MVTCRALGLVQQVVHPRLGRMDVLGKGVTVGDDPREIERHAPLLGEHSVEVLAELGLSAHDIETLVTDRVVFRPAFAEFPAPVRQTPARGRGRG